LSTALATRNGTDASIMERVLIVGDLAKLTAEERVSYYAAVCRSVGLNPLTKPFDYLNLKGKLTLYAKKDATDQLRTIRGISIIDLKRHIEDDFCIVWATARDASGRTDLDMGAVHIAGLRGEDLANAMLKAVTKAKRRVTLSIAGLGWLDETEVTSIPNAMPADEYSSELDDVLPSVVEADGVVEDAAPDDTPQSGAGMDPASWNDLRRRIEMCGQSGTKDEYLALHAEMTAAWDGMSEIQQTRIDDVIQAAAKAITQRRKTARAGE
jgi:hypothetical protein